MGYFQNENYDVLMDFSSNYLPLERPSKDSPELTERDATLASLKDATILEALFRDEDIIKIALSKPGILDKVINVLRSMDSVAEMDSSMTQEKDKHEENESTDEQDVVGSTKQEAKTSGSAGAVAQPAPPTDSATLPASKPAKQEQKTTEHKGISAEAVEKIKDLCDYRDLPNKYYDEIKYKNMLELAEKQLKLDKTLLSTFKSEQDLINHIIKYITTPNQYLAMDDVELILYIYCMSSPELFIMRDGDDSKRFEKRFYSHKLQLEHFFKTVNNSKK